MTTGRKVLVIGDDTRSFLGIVRSLGRAGIEVHVAPFNFRSPSLRSRYISRICRLPFYMGDGQQWVDALRKLVAEQGYDLILPCDERALLPLDRHRAVFEMLSQLAIPSSAAIAALFDKHKTRELAASVGVRIPKGRLLESGEPAAALIAAFGLPLAVKPRQSFALDRLHARGSVKVVEDAASLASVLETVESGRFLVEAFVPGHGRGVSVLADRGIILLAFEHHRVHEFAAGSYYRRSAPLTPDLLDAARKIIAALDYTGVAMFEFRFDAATGDWALLEVNARPWGSLPLALAAGVDFPFRWFQLLVAGKQAEWARYRPDLYGRHFTGDLYYLAWAAGQLRGKPLRLMGFLAKSTGEFGRILVGREVSDTFARDDARPALVEIAQLAAERFANVAERVPAIRTLRRRRSRARAADAIAGTAEIVFVCHGNICRSAFAARLLEAMLLGRAPPIAVSSAGMLPVEGRPSTADAIAVAQELGVDLSGHVSRFLTAEQIAHAALIIVFEPANAEQIRRRYADIGAPIVRLGDLAEGKMAGADIADPYGHDRATYRRTFEQIGAGISGLIGLLPPRS